MDAEIRRAMSSPYERPIRVVPAGKWTVWACGHCSVASRCAAPLMSVNEGPRITASEAAELVTLVEAPRGLVVSAKALAAWCEKHCASRCWRCGGAGDVVYVCPHAGCDHAHTARCGLCDGAGTTGEPPDDPRPVGIGGVEVDARAVLSMLATFGDRQITVERALFGGADVPVLVFGHETTVAILAGTKHNRELATWGDGKAA